MLLLLLFFALTRLIPDLLAERPLKPKIATYTSWLASDANLLYVEVVVKVLANFYYIILYLCVRRTIMDIGAEV